MPLGPTTDASDAEPAAQDGTGDAPGPGDYLLTTGLRRGSKWLAIFVAYSQFASVAFLFAYRTQDAWVRGRGYEANHGVFEKFLVPFMPFPAGKVGMFAGFPIWLTVSAGVVLAVLGSAGLFGIGRARCAWRWRQALLFLAFVLGLATAGLIALVHLVSGASSVNFLGTELENYYFFHGVLEFLGATAVPALAYSALAVYLPTRTVMNILRNHATER